MYVRSVGKSQVREKIGKRDYITHSTSSQNPILRRSKRIRWGVCVRGEGGLVRRLERMEGSEGHQMGGVMLEPLCYRPLQRVTGVANRLRR